MHTVACETSCIALLQHVRAHTLRRQSTTYSTHYFVHSASSVKCREARAKKYMHTCARIHIHESVLRADMDGLPCTAHCPVLPDSTPSTVSTGQRECRCEEARLKVTPVVQQVSALVQTMFESYVQQVSMLGSYAQQVSDRIGATVVCFVADHAQQLPPKAGACSKNRA
jgi:hypothetical protein